METASIAVQKHPFYFSVPGRVHDPVIWGHQDNRSSSQSGKTLQLRDSSREVYHFVEFEQKNNKNI